MNMISRKRKRDSESDSVDWSTVPADVLGLILSKISRCVEDCVCFASTCRWWRSVARDSKISVPLNWLMPISRQNDTDTRVFYDVARSKHLRFHLPEIRGHTCFGSRFGWLVTYDGVNQISLFNPISRASVPLPGDTEALTRCLPNCRRCLTGACPFAKFRVLKAVLTASPEDPDCLVVIEYKPRKLAYAKPHDAVWSLVPLESERGFFFYLIDFVYFKRNLYCLSIDTHVAVFELSSPSSSPKAVLAPPQLHPRLPNVTREHAHLLEMGGELCMVVNYGYFYYDPFAEIFKLDAATETMWSRVESPCLILQDDLTLSAVNVTETTWNRVESLGNLCLVLQDDLTLSAVNVEEDDKLIPGCMYFPNLGRFGSPEDYIPLEGVYYRATEYIPRCIYYPITQADLGTPAWAIKGFYPDNLNPHSDTCDVYTKLYPSIRFTTLFSLHNL